MYRVFVDSKTNIVCIQECKATFLLQQNNNYKQKIYSSYESALEYSKRLRELVCNTK